MVASHATLTRETARSSSVLAGRGLRLLVLAIGALGCGTTQIFAEEPTARIWANGQLVGRGHGEIQMTGLPETTTIRVEAEDGRQETTTVKRSVTGLTVLGALFTYGTCLIVCWQYPETVWASLPPGPRMAGPMSAASRDPWLDPDPGWMATTPAPNAARPVDPQSLERGAAPSPPPTARPAP